MQVVLLRVGIDTGSGGIHGPIFPDGSFEYIPIPDRFKSMRIDNRTYGNTRGRTGQLLIDYFPTGRRDKVAAQSIHFDPEFETFTYGDPTPPKASLRRLTEGSLLVFYAGLEGWGFDCPPALYIIAYFEVANAGLATSYHQADLGTMFGSNFHVMHGEVFDEQKERLVLVKGSANSRLLRTAVRISSMGTDRNGRPLQRLAPEMQRVFGSFDGHTGIQRCPPRWVAAEIIPQAAEFILSLR
jgi:Nucleotide modification associated domain 3